MLDMGFIHDIRAGRRQAAGQRRQRCSSPPPCRARSPSLPSQMLRDPVRVAVTPGGHHGRDASTQRVIHVDRAGKPALLAEVLRNEPIDRALVFTRTKHGADKVVRALDKAGLAAEAIHGNKSQNQRERVLAAFRAGRVRIAGRHRHRRPRHRRRRHQPRRQLRPAEHPGELRASHRPHRPRRRRRRRDLVLRRRGARLSARHREADPHVDPGDRPAQRPARRARAAPERRRANAGTVAPAAARPQPAATASRAAASTKVNGTTAASRPATETAGRSSLRLSRNSTAASGPQWRTTVRSPRSPSCSNPSAADAVIPEPARRAPALNLGGTSMAKEELLEFDGTVTEVLPDGNYRVTLDNEHQILAYMSGKMRKFRIRTGVGDRVIVEVSPYDLDARPHQLPPQERAYGSAGGRAPAQFPAPLSTLDMLSSWPGCAAVRPPSRQAVTACVIFGVHHDHLAYRPARHRHRSQAAGNPGLPADQRAARIRRGEAGADLALRQARLSDPRRHPDHARRTRRAGWIDGGLLGVIIRESGRSSNRRCSGTA